ncbi:uncharacterized protein At4g06598-like [Phalaenopsis equestris]|uniref:uncharacterized protein At4g06598-like n=1 Tax=Phalaenopsis equestris TaxID=78828 RepID=UPI0009E3F0A9|nr:uncharacterized protein At4g06598-like [Phalaenopsis equestris]XP_020575376.1 uncharacterized protein At4g06598-like [Phalaenopsis equestris]
MESMKVASTSRNTGKQSFLPPKSPFPSIAAPGYADFGSSGPHRTPKLREGSRSHQRTSSESFLIEEQPSWLDDLLNEPETPAPVRRGAHRRSSSDSFAYMDGSFPYSNTDNLFQGECKGRTITSMPSWSSLEFDPLKNIQHHHLEGNLFSRNLFNGQQNRVWESALNVRNYSKCLPAAKEKNMHTGSFSATSKEPEVVVSCAIEKLVQEECPKGSMNLLEKKEANQMKNSQSEFDSKRVKQQFAQRSRVRKLQYIAELEKNVQALQAEQMEVSAELEFLDQQNLILNLENKALKQRLDSLAQEHLVKCLQQDMLEREIARLRSLFHQQQQKLPQEAAPSHSRSRSRDLDSQFANLSIKHTEGNSGRDPASGFNI